MLVSNPNNIKIYNLSAGKSLPEWLSDRKKRALQKAEPELRQRINLIQDFDMPTVSTAMALSKDGQYLFVSGVYKPVAKCFELSQLSMKFERGMDAEVVKMKVLSDDYSKVVYLQDNRFVELHNQSCKYYRTRIPRFGRDLAYHKSSCDMYFVCDSSEIYRLNFEQGRYMKPLKADSRDVLCCEFNPVHELFTCGTIEGHVECWDPRVKNRVGKLDIAMEPSLGNIEGEIPSVTSIKYRDALQLAVGTATGQILLYDIRSNKPLLVKDHNYGLPIQSIDFNRSQNLVLSLDRRILKIWENDNGKAVTSIEPGEQLNSLCAVPDTGMLFMTNEAPKILSYYIPALGPAPRWAAFLDNITEELEENQGDTVYDDYKFVTHRELEALGLSHLIGTNILRAYMHGFFIDMRLYSKAKRMVEPFAYEQYRKQKVREKIEEERAHRVTIPDKLPKVNRELAEKLIEHKTDQKNRKKQKMAQTLLQDDRFSKMFKDADFQVDTASEDYRRLLPALARLETTSSRRKQPEPEQEMEDVGEDEEEEGRGSDVSSDDSSDEEQQGTWSQKTRDEFRRSKRAAEERADREKMLARKKESAEDDVKMYTVKSGHALTANAQEKALRKQQKLAKRTLGERLQHERSTDMVLTSGSARGSMEMSFKLQKKSKESQRRDEDVRHHKERKKLRRPAGKLSSSKNPVPPKYWSRSQKR